MVNGWQELGNKKDENGMEDINLDWNLDKCDSRSLGSLSMDTSSILSDADDLDFDDDSQVTMVLHYQSNILVNCAFKSFFVFLLPF